MKTSSSPAMTILGSLALAILAAWLAFGIANGITRPILSGERAAHIGFVIVAIALCGLGIGRVSATGQWLHPLAIISYVPGGVTLLVAATGLFGFVLPYVQGARDAILVLSGIMALKLVLSFIHTLLWK